MAAEGLTELFDPEYADPDLAELDADDDEVNAMRQRRHREEYGDESPEKELARDANRFFELDDDDDDGAIYYQDEDGNYYRDEYLGDVVTRGDRRMRKEEMAQDDRYDSRGGSLWSTNLDGVLGTNSAKDPEMTRYRQRRAVVTANYSMAEEALSLSERFEKAKERALKESASSNADDPRKFRLWTDDARTLATFDPDVRIRDSKRALHRYANHPESMHAIEEASVEAYTVGRGHFGAHMRDLLWRVRQTSAAPVGQRQRRVRFTQKKSQEPPLPQEIRARQRVGRAVSRSHMRRRQQQQSGARVPTGPGEADAFRPPDDERIILEAPVFSVASWSFVPHEPLKEKAMDDGVVSADVEDHYASFYRKQAGVETTADRPKGMYIVGPNDAFLSEQIGLTTPEAMATAERDAVQFFSKKFGLDFGPKSGATRNPKTGGLIRTDLGVAMVPYVVRRKQPQDSPQQKGVDGYRPVLVAVEGHLSSAQASDDELRNGRLIYEHAAEGTSVCEGGWMVRVTGPNSVVLPSVAEKGPWARGAKLTRGAVLLTGFWVMDRPQAPPCMLRFQSASPSTITASKTSGGHIVHTLTVIMDVYDMAHDVMARPAQGFGRAMTEVRRVSRDGSLDPPSMHTIVAIRH